MTNNSKKPLSVLYDGSVDILKYHPYKIIDRVLGLTISPPGVTSIVGQFSKDGLLQWSANEAARSALDLTKEGKLSDSEIIKIASHAYLEKRDNAADGGTEGHKWIETYVRGELGEDYSFESEYGINFVEAYLEFEKDYKLEDSHPEDMLYSREFRYAGTRDDYVLINGKRYTLDYKTGNPDFEYNTYRKRYTGSARAYDTHFMQCAGYDIASEECLGQDSEGYAILYLIKDPVALSKKYGIPVKKYFFFTTEDTDYWRDRFICALDYWYYSHEGKNKYKEVR